MTNWVFPATRDFFREFSAINDFTQVCAASVWTMRWQVKGFFAEAGFYGDPPHRPSDGDLRARFLAGSGLTRANFRSLVDGQTWSQQSETLADMILLTFVALFEGWAHRITAEVALTKVQGDGLQWPSHKTLPRFRGKSPLLGAPDVVAIAVAIPSPVMATCFYPVLQKNRHFVPQNLDALLIMYRYWKELRNAVAHNGGRATPSLLVAQQNAAKLTATQLGLKVVPLTPAVALDTRISLDLSTVLAFGEVLHKIATTLDAQFATSKGGESQLIHSWRLYRDQHRQDLPLAGAKREARIVNWVEWSGLPRPTAVATLDGFLSDQFGISLRVW
jgi:hypothetical protein